MKIISDSKLDTTTHEGYLMQLAFEESSNTDKKVTFGKAVIRQNAKIPRHGFGAHEQNEFSYIIKGSLKVFSNNESSYVKAGDYSFIPAGQEHRCENVGSEDCELIWVLV